MSIKKLKMKINRINKVTDINTSCRITISYNKRTENSDAYIEILYENINKIQDRYYNIIDSYTRSYPHASKIMYYAVYLTSRNYIDTKNFEKKLLNEIYDIIEREYNEHLVDIEDFKNALNLKYRPDKIKRIINENN